MIGRTLQRNALIARSRGAVFERDYRRDPGLGASPTFTRAAGAATVTDHEGIVRTDVATNEIRYPGWRRERNLFTGSTATLASGSATTAVTVGVGTYTFAMGAGSGRATFSGTATGATGTLDAHASNRTAKVLTITVGGTIIVTASLAALANISLANTTGQLNTAPGDYVSVGVLSAPYHGFGADGVKYFKTTNENSVDANGVVTENPGTPIAVTGGPLVEPTGTNNVLNSDNVLLSGWEDGSGTVRATSGVANPDGSIGNNKVSDTAASSTHYIRNNATCSFTSGTSYILYARCKQGIASWVQLVGTSGAFGSNVYANFDLSVGSVGNIGSACTAGIQSYGNGWYTCWIVAPATATANTNAILIALTNNSNALRLPTYAGSGQYIYEHGAGCVVGTVLTSHIPTGGAAAIRAADSSISYSLTTPQNEGMAIIECAFPSGSPTTTEKGILSLRSASAQSILYGPAGSAVLRGTDGTNDADTASAFPVTGACTMAIRWNAATGKMQTSILKSGTWTTSGEATYDGTTTTDNVVRLASSAAYPMLVKSARVYSRDRGQAWIQKRYS